MNYSPLIKTLREEGASIKESDSKFDALQLAAGILVELEHTESFAAAKEIAKDHLAEDSKYYSQWIFPEEAAERLQDLEDTSFEKELLEINQALYRVSDKKSWGDFIPVLSGADKSGYFELFSAIKKINSDLDKKSYSAAYSFYEPISEAFGADFANKVVKAYEIAVTKEGTYSKFAQTLSELDPGITIDEYQSVLDYLEEDPLVKLLDDYKSISSSFVYLRDRFPILSRLSLDVSCDLFFNRIFKEKNIPSSYSEDLIIRVNSTTGSYSEFHFIPLSEYTYQLIEVDDNLCLLDQSKSDIWTIQELVLFCKKLMSFVPIESAYYLPERAFVNSGSYPRGTKYTILNEENCGGNYSLKVMFPEGETSTFIFNSKAEALRKGWLSSVYHEDVVGLPYDLDTFNLKGDSYRVKDKTSYSNNFSFTVVVNGNEHRIAGYDNQQEAENDGWIFQNLSNRSLRSNKKHSTGMNTVDEILKAYKAAIAKDGTYTTFLKELKRFGRVTNDEYVLALQYLEDNNLKLTHLCD